MNRYGWLPCLLTTALSLLCLHAGCGGDAKTYGKLRGRVTSEGQPVVEAIVLFEEPSQHIFIQAVTDSNGHYDFEKFPGGGLPVGSYRVAIQRPIQEIRTGEPLPTPKPFPRIDAKYFDPEKSGLQLQVTAGENSFDVELPRRKK